MGGQRGWQGLDPASGSPRCPPEGPLDGPRLPGSRRARRRPQFSLIHPAVWSDFSLLTPLPHPTLVSGVPASRSLASSPSLAEFPSRIFSPLRRAESSRPSPPACSRLWHDPGSSRVPLPLIPQSRWGCGLWACAQLQGLRAGSSGPSLADANPLLRGQLRVPLLRVSRALPLALTSVRAHRRRSGNVE